MLKLTLHQMRTGWARLLAAGIAIMLGTGFVAASFLAGNVLTSATNQSVTAPYRGSDLIVMGAALTEQTVATLGDLDGVIATDLITQTGGEISNGSRTEWGVIGVRPRTDALLLGTVTSGSLPTSDGEVALTESLARRLHTSVGETITVSVTSWEQRGETEQDSTRYDDFAVVGLLSDPSNLFDPGAGLLVTPEALRTLAPSAVERGGLGLAVSPGAQAEQVAHEARALLGSDALILTKEQVANRTIAGISGGTNPLTAVLLAFAGVALAVAALVIGNTFSVLVAQRTRLLAMLRTIGATRGQVRRSVLLEASLLGLLSAALGLALGYGVVAGAIAVLSARVPGIDLWEGAGLTVGTAVTVVAIGVGVTLIAGWVPARAATRIKPLAALRPEPVRLGSTAGRRRALVAAGAAVIGGALLAGGMVLPSLANAGSRGGDAVLLLALAMGIIGGFLSVLGMLFGAVFAISGLIRSAGRLFGTGATTRIAVANSVRNPRRTAATTNALFIGVALVVLMSTGAATAKATLDAELTGYYPVDVQVTAVDGAALTPAQVAAATRSDGVAAITAVSGVQVEIIATPDQPDSDSEWASLAAPSDGAALGDASLIQGLSSGGIVIDSGKARRLGVQVGDVVYVRTTTAVASSAETAPSTGGLGTNQPGDDPGGVGDGSSSSGEDGNTGARPAEIPLTVSRIATGGDLALTTPDSVRALAPEAPLNEMWLRLAPEANAMTVVADLQDALTDVQDADPNAPLVSVQGAAIERGTYGELIDTMLLVVIALLAVAVVIALVGVANTLSLSVIERRRESATLRALGLTKRQLRGMLAIEGVLIALVGALVGAVGGLVYGWAGSWILLRGFGAVSLVVPWQALAWIIAVAALAGVAASVIPARSAVKVSPVAALAEQ